MRFSVAGPGRGRSINPAQQGLPLILDRVVPSLRSSLLRDACITVTIQVSCASIAPRASLGTRHPSSAPRDCRLQHDERPKAEHHLSNRPTC